MNISRILLGLLLIVGAGGAMIGGTGAFFSDTETSTGNTFTAGAIDLKIDNESYYNGVFNDGTSWDATDLVDEKFFDFDDVKPNDYGEDTISIHVDTNDAYMCADITLTSNDDNEPNEPEALDDTDTGVGLGELADIVEFVWWADDGDNVLEADESVISQGPIGALTLQEPHTVVLADSTGNIWTDLPGPIPGDETMYIGKAWCVGTIGTAPDDQDGGDLGKSPAGDNNANATAGEPEDGGITCDGSLLDNAAQTDSLTADISFSAVQARNNPNFQCIDDEDTTLTLQKVVINDDFGDADDGDFTLTADGPTALSGVEGTPAVTNASVAAGAYTISEVGVLGYSLSVSCSINGGAPIPGNVVNIAEGDEVICTLTNDDLSGGACTPAVRFADAAGTFDQGKQKEGDPVLANRSVPSAAFGAPQTTGTPMDAGFPVGSFVSLGFVGTSSATASLILEFTNNLVVNGAGADMRLYEVTGGVYPDEHVKVEISQDGSTWFTAVADGVRDIDVDINGILPWAKFVRVTDLNNPALFPADADGYDVDALEALN
ncbi:MAG: SipW-dependent-type signal peptide-containing protein, partial [Minisyncoccia bacterium]